MKKDLIVISSYCDTFQKEEQLRNLVKTLSKDSSWYDIMVVSHTPIPSDIALCCDWAIYDKKNIRLERLDCIGLSWCMVGDRVINSVYTCPGILNTYHISIWRMMATGNMLAEKMGYENVHHLEYDTDITSMQELEENSKMLKTYDAIIYELADGMMLGCYQAYKVSAVTHLIKNILEKEWEDLSANSNVKCPETLLEGMITKGTHVYRKSVKTLEESGIYVNKSKVDSHGYLTWCFPYYEETDDSLHFYVFNDTQEEVKIDLIYNGKLITLKVVPDVWHAFSLDPNYQNAKELIVMVNNKVRQEYMFDEIREFFKISSYASPQ